MGHDLIRDACAVARGISRTVAAGAFEISDLPHIRFGRRASALNYQPAADDGHFQSSHRSRRTTMLAEMFVLRLESLLRKDDGAKELPKSNARFVPITLKRD
jgi:hypothetical protein